MSSANTYIELEEMLKSFRCQDLANLLAFAGQSKNGKKSELFDRCVNILKKGNTNIQLKIKEIYNAKVSTSTVNNYSSLISAINSNSNSGSSSPDPNMLNRYQVPAPAAAGPPSIYGNSFNQFPNNHTIPNNGAYQHGITTRSNVFGSANNANFSNNQSFKVQFEKLAFFQFLHELHPANKMQIVNPNQRPFSYWFNFFMTIDQANEITGTREMISGKLEYSKQIHLRFGYFEHTLQVDNLPANLTVNINGRPAALPAPKPTSKPNADIIRPGRSIDVTSLCRLAPNIPNKVEINWTNADPSKQYCVGVYVFKKVSVQSLVQNLKLKCVKEPEMTRQMVREKLQITDSDFEIETSTLKVSLLCPLMKTRLQLPGRSFKCKHVQCFELESYLMMNEKKPTWNCPVCDQNAPYDDLIIDGLNQEIITKCTDADEIQFAADGTWTKVSENEKIIPAKKKHDDVKKSGVEDDETCVEICDLSLSPPTVKRNNSTSDILQTTNNTTSTNNNKKDDDCIDLTVESDEEMPLQPSINSNNKVNGSNPRSLSRSSSNNSSIFTQQVSNEAQASSDSNPFNDENNGPRNKNINNNNHINKLNNINKDMRPEENNKNNSNKATTSLAAGQSATSNLSPSQSIISLSSNSSILDDHSRSQTPTNLDKLNDNATHIITNISKLFQNEPLSLNSTHTLTRPPTTSSSSSTISVPMEESAPISIPSANEQANSRPVNTPTNNPVLSNSQLARGLSAPSPTRNYSEGMNISPILSSNNNNIRPNSSSSSLNSIPNILENLRNSNMSPISTQQSNSKIYSPNSKSSGQQSPMQPKKLSMDNPHTSMSSNRSLDERLIQSKPTQQHLQNHQNLPQQQQQRSNVANIKSNMPQRPNEHTLVNSNNKVNNLNKYPHKRAEYLTKEKALMVNEELKSMQSNTNLSMLDQNYKNRNVAAISSIVSGAVTLNPQFASKSQQQGFNNNIKTPNRNSFDAEQMNTQAQLKNNQSQSNLINKSNQLTQNLNNNKSVSLSNLNPTQKQTQPQTQQQQQQRINYDQNRPGSTDPSLTKPKNYAAPNQLAQKQQFNNNVANLNNIQKAASKTMSSTIQQHLHGNVPQQKQSHGSQLASLNSNSSQPYYKNNVISPSSISCANPVQNISPNNKQGFTQCNNRPSNLQSQTSMNNLHQQHSNMNYQMNKIAPGPVTSSGSIPPMVNNQHFQTNRLNPNPYSMSGSVSQSNHFYSNQPNHPQMQQQIRHQQQQQQQHAHQH